MWVGFILIMSNLLCGFLIREINHYIRIHYNPDNYRERIQELGLEIN